MDARTRAVTSIAQAKLELDRALAEVDAIRPFDPALIGAVAHALNNYISVTVATIEMLQLTLRGHDDPDVPIWLDGIRHATELMHHSVGRLVSTAAPTEFPLKLDYVSLPILMERACEYYRRRAETDSLTIVCATVGQIPLVWGDRVALGVVADNLLSNAVQFSRRHGTIHVQIMPEPGHVVCSIRDSGPGLTPEQQARLFSRPLAEGRSPDAGPDVGFGLAVADAFLRRMDGDLWCQSEPGAGACFSFRLPALE
jgi:signal transduction histidine kinase